MAETTEHGYYIFATGNSIYRTQLSEYAQEKVTSCFSAICVQ